MAERHRRRSSEIPWCECVNCGTTFRHKAGTTGKFCRPDCYNEYRKSQTAARTEKHCTICQQTKPVDQFCWNGSKWKTLESRCRECKNSLYPAWSRKKRYGLSEEQFASRLADQGGSCAVCGATETLSGKAFAVDHDHNCCPSGFTCGNCLRGILCGNCNTAIGMLHDSIETVLNVASYLESWNIELWGNPNGKEDK